MKKFVILLLIVMFCLGGISSVFAEFEEYDDNIVRIEMDAVDPSRNGEVVGYETLFGECIAHHHNLRETLRMPIKEIKESQTEGDKFHLYVWTDPATQKKYAYFRTYDLPLMRRHPEKGVRYKTKKVLFDDIGFITITGWDNRNGQFLYSKPYYTEISCTEDEIEKKPILWLPAGYVIVEEAEDPAIKGAALVVPAAKGSNREAGTIYEDPNFVPPNVE